MRNPTISRHRFAGVLVPIALAWGCGGGGDTTGDDDVLPDDGWTEGSEVLTGDDGGDIPEVVPDADGIDGDSTEVGDDSGEEVCTPLPAELCNNLDDTCDGVTDEGFDLTSDPDNCGACGVPCYTLPNADALCVDGECIVAACLAGFYDINESPADGCEYECSPRLSRESWDDGTCEDGLDNECDGRTDLEDSDCSECFPELCDALDNDCDGLTDEEFDTDFDPLNCGECGLACPGRPNATPACVLGQCDIVCEPGWTDANGNLVDGCETTCTPSGITDEIECNGVDDDCDGRTDEDYVRDVCGTGFCERRSVCHRGVVVACTPRTPPATVDVTCDGVDENCNGSTDEGFVGITCGTGVCAAESTCMDGFEVPCTEGFPTSVDDASCDGLDNNCDNDVDEDYVPSLTCGTGVCLNDYACVDGAETCDPLPTDTEACGDALDNDCDTLTDEEGATGCTVYYNDTDRDGYGVTTEARCLCSPLETWDTEAPGDCDDRAAAVNPAAAEVCDGIDNDCDVQTDPEGSGSCTDYFTDVDGDGYGTGASRCFCAPTGDYRATRALDCDDALPGVNPGATETCATAYDDDCDLQANERDVVGW